MALVVRRGPGLQNVGDAVTAILQQGIFRFFLPRAVPGSRARGLVFSARFRKWTTAGKAVGRISSLPLGKRSEIVSADYKIGSHS